MKLAAPSLLLLSSIAAAAANPGANIQRTMTLLATSTPQHKNEVRILFYGQSITKQEWARAVAEDLRQRFPDAALTIENRSIGGYDSPRLIRTLPHDVYAFYPDLVIFYDYGPEPEYEQMIRDIRTHTTAEIAIQTDHIAVEDAERKARHDKHSYEWLPRIAAQYGCELIDQRHPWEEYLRANHRVPQDLLKDGVHLNEHGNKLMADLVNPYLRYDPAIPPDKWKALTQTYPAKWKHGRMKLEFDGNRIDLIGVRGSGLSAQVLIDGKPPSQFPEMYTITRPSDTWSVDWPALNHVAFDEMPIIEKWTARVLDKADDDSQFIFEVTGSKTGMDGTGDSRERFVSQSRRVVIEPRDWEGIKRARDLKNVPMPKGFTVTWEVKPMFVDVYNGAVSTVAQNLPNGHHTLELISNSKPAPPILEIRAYRPPLQ